MMDEKVMRDILSAANRIEGLLGEWVKDYTIFAEAVVRRVTASGSGIVLVKHGQRLRAKGAQVLGSMQETGLKRRIEQMNASYLRYGMECLHFELDSFMGVVANVGAGIARVNTFAERPDKFAYSIPFPSLAHSGRGAVMDPELLRAMNVWKSGLHTLRIMAESGLVLLREDGPVPYSTISQGVAFGSGREVAAKVNEIRGCLEVPNESTA